MEFSLKSYKDLFNLIKSSIDISMLIKIFLKLWRFLLSLINIFINLIKIF